MPLMDSLKDVSLIIATFNEEDSIGFVLDEIVDYDFHEVIIVDGESKDKTIDIASKYKTKIITQKNKGWGSAVLEGFNYATGKYITYMDGDGSYRPSSIYEMRKHIENYDAVFCSRYKDGNKSPDDTFIRLLGNKLFTKIVRNLVSKSITDALFFFPLIKKKDFDKITPRNNDFTICVEIPVLISKLSTSYLDLLSTERERYSGISKVNALIDGTKILYGIAKLKLRKI